MAENPNDAGWVSKDGLIAINLESVLSVRWIGDLSVYVQFKDQPVENNIISMSFQNFESLRNKFIQYLSKH